MENMKNSGAIAFTNQHIPCFKNNNEAALYWHQFGFDVIPIVPLLKQPAVKWDSWLDGLNAEKIAAHWAKHPNHELGFIVGDSYFVLDADSPESVLALKALEKESGMPPLMVVTTKRGEHHYYKRSKDTFARSDAHSTEQHPDRIDVKTGRAIVILPPSTGKAIKSSWVESADKLFGVGQGFIDMVFQHNGREAPRPPIVKTAHTEALEIDSKTYQQLAALLDQLDPEEGGHNGWVRIGMAIHTETGGDDEGLKIFDQWSRRGSTYPGPRVIDTKWRSFGSSREDRCNLGTIINRVKAAGKDWMEACSVLDTSFEPCEYEVIETNLPAPENAKVITVRAGTLNPLDSFSLLGMSDEIARDAQEQKPILCGLAMLGQATAIFAPPNSGKTLITTSNICEDIRHGRVEASKVYYVNVDDSGQGLANKLAIADEYGFHMLSEGYREFNASDLLGIMIKMVAANQAIDVIIILDTIKKFTNLMDKTKASQFTKVVRQFVMKGGTVIGMAHTNKKLGTNGKPVYGGTSDIVDDFDCAYTIATEDGSNPTEKIVVFDNIKRRGSNPIKVAYRYSIESGLTYNEILMSVERVDDDQLAKVAQVAKGKPDADVIASVLSCIAQGVNTKMLLAGEVAKVAGISKRQALAVIERYTGNDPAVHKWSFAVRERGAKVFTVLDQVTTG
jgi:hypothetical protein